MKISEKWLRELLDLKVSIDSKTLADQLTMLGLEIEGIVRVAPEFKGVVVGEVLEVTDHPNAEQLHLCQVNVGNVEPLSIVCGATNVRAGLKVAVALIGAVLPGNFRIKKAKLRGIESHGMLCSAVELGLAETCSGILELSSDAPIGKDIRDYFELDDNVIEIKVTPNRGDCLSVLGIARELCALNRTPLKKPEMLQPIPSAIKSSDFKVLIKTAKARKACPHYVGCIIRGINNRVQTPLWMQERLRRSGLRSIHPVVDVTNYVLLELGQPLHGFDLAKIARYIEVRFASEDEKLTLLDSSIKNLTSNDLIIADSEKPLALAGVMGGHFSGVDENTTDIFLESAYFAPKIIRSSAKHHGLQTDSSYRFERGVDPTLQLSAANRAARLITEIAGGKREQIIEEIYPEDLPTPAKIKLHRTQVKRVLGIELSDTETETILHSLNMKLEVTDQGWLVEPPSYRFDINLEEDLLEELARLHGYNIIPEQKIIGELLPQATTQENYVARQQLSDLLLAKGYREVITYSFIDNKLQQLLDPECLALQLANPIAKNMQAMRTSLWPGLVNSVLINQARHRNRMRLFEIGLCFRQDAGGAALLQEPLFAAVATGSVYPEQWGITTRQEDFFDVKNDVEYLLKQLGYVENVKFVAYSHPALHPKRCAKIYLDEMIIGYVGELNPKIQQKLELLQKVYLFELKLSLLNKGLHKRLQKISKFPAIQRDIALVVSDEVSWQQIKKKIVAITGEILQYIQVFDVYSGSGLGTNERSIGVRLIFQDAKRTLVDQEIEKLMNNVLLVLKESFNVKLRG